MKSKTFKAELLPGHKQNAVEVPFNPEVEWGFPAQKLWRGRNGYPVRARIRNVSFASSIVPRQKKFYLLIEDAVVQETNLGVGDVVAVSVARAPESNATR